MTGPGPEQPADLRRPIDCPRCGAAIAGDQAWCLECGLAARTRLAPAPNWRAPLIVAGIVGLAAMVALVVAFLVLTGDNAPLPTTAAPAATAPPVDTVPPAAATTAAATSTTPIPTTTTTATPTVGVPAVSVPTVPTITVPAATTP